MGSDAMGVSEVLCLVAVVAGQQTRTQIETNTPPVPILRYIDRHNLDGSYTYGFQSVDGTYKLETRQTDGQVRGQFGYFDDLGQWRESSYGAGAQTGFQSQVPTQTVRREGQILTQREGVERDQGEVRLVNGRRAVLRRRRFRKKHRVLHSHSKDSLLIMK